ncbi:CKLF-like MARVEL transmembrane domain-containing protein 6 [Cheilinus undulatus]|uniref:CKLF-like MARVEL transmembrane domain-containing protein 6 n=1 Tax=Cheilinus undulatus TaxID=241271 RepID=UPI001BD293FC|nr:CKLF-like MARVEL transmembrane domain-containing protein 6 [Cheilinus undulatus]
MATSTVYAPTTVSDPKSSCFTVPSDLLEMPRFIIKVLQVVLSFLAFILEEVVNSCLNCTALYFFEFVSCTAFLFTLLLLVLLSTNLHSRVGITCWPKLDFVYTALIALLFFIASIVFAADNGNSTVEQVAVAFGFLASIAFLADLVLFMMNRGFPLSKDTKSAPSDGGAVPGNTPGETEKLAPAANGREEV